MALNKEELAEVTDMIAIAAAKAAIVAIKEAKFISDESHYNHHTWIAAKIKREEALEALLTELAKHVTKWGAVGVLSFVFYGIYLAIKRGLAT